MATDFSDIFQNITFASLLILSAIAFVISIQSSNDAPQPIVEDALLNNSFSGIEGSLSSLGENGQTQYSQFSSESPQPGFSSIVLFGIVATGKTFGSLMLSSFALIVKLPILVLGLPNTLFSTIAAWLTISAIVALWILYKVGG